MIPNIHYVRDGHGRLLRFVAVLSNTLRLSTSTEIFGPVTSWSLPMASLW